MMVLLVERLRKGIDCEKKVRIDDHGPLSICCCCCFFHNFIYLLNMGNTLLRTSICPFNLLVS